MEGRRRGTSKAISHFGTSNAYLVPIAISWSWPTILVKFDRRLLAVRWLSKWFQLMEKASKVLFFLSFFLNRKFHHQWHRVLSCLQDGQYKKTKAGLLNNHLAFVHKVKKWVSFRTVFYEIISISFWNMEFSMNQQETFSWNEKRGQRSRQRFLNISHPRENSLRGIFFQEASLD